MSLEPTLDKGDDFQVVELAAAVSGPSPFYVENSTNITSTIILLFLFIAMHIFAAFRSPSLLSLKHEYFPFNKTDGNITVDLDITLTLLLDSHKFINVNGSLIRSGIASTAELSLPVEFTARTIFTKNHTVLNTFNSEKNAQTLLFKERERNSTEFHVAREEIRDFDTVEVKMSLTADLTSIDGFSFTWSYANLSATKYSRAAKILMSLLIGYMLLIFSSVVNLETESFSQIFCVIVGIAGVCFSNPIALVLPSVKSARISDHVLMAAFVGLFRMFLMIQLEMIRTQSMSPKIILTIIVGLFFGFYATIDAAASYDRANFIIESENILNTILPTEKVLIEVHFAYAAACIVWIMLTLTQAKGYSNRRMWLFISLTILNLIATLIAQVAFPIMERFMFTILPNMIIASTHVTSAAFSIFFMHQGGDPDYAPMDGNDINGALDVEQMSDGDIEEDGLLDDDEEEEEEEEEE